MRKRLRKIIKKLNTPKAATKFKQIQLDHGVQTPKAPVLSFKTRWNSNCTMFEDALELKTYIKLAEEDADFLVPTRHKLRPSDWALIPKVLKLLTPLKTATLVFEGDNSSISEVIPVVKQMKLQIQAIDERGTTAFKNALIQQIDNYLGGKDARPHFVDIEKCPIYTYATLLDPRYKADYFTIRTNADFAKLSLREHCKRLQAEEATVLTHVQELEAQDQGNPSANVLSWDDCLLEENDNINDTSQGFDEELNLYFSARRIDMNADPLAYWKAHHNQFPTISKVAIEYLCPPSSSAASEREFSISGLIMTPKRNRLLPKNLEQLLFLKYNIRATGYTNLPSPPSEFHAVNTLLQTDQNRETLDNNGLSDSDGYDESDDSSASDVSCDESP